MKYYVPPGSIVRQIWGSSDTVLFIFAGAAAEFALNKAVDWLYFTGKLPADPLGRLFSTAAFARMIVFSPEAEALRTIENIRKIHVSVETKRGQLIPDHAYRDVLFMLIHYSIAVFELLERSLATDEKEEVYEVFYRVGVGMGLQELPPDYHAWITAREEHLRNNLVSSRFTTDLFRQYRRHLGLPRYLLLRECQKLVTPLQVQQLLGFGKTRWLAPLVPVFTFSKKLRLDPFIRFLLYPPLHPTGGSSTPHPTGGG